MENHQNLIITNMYLQMFNIAIHIDIMSMLKGYLKAKSSIMDTHMDKVSMMKMNTWTFTRTKCPSSLSHQNIAKLARFNLYPKDSMSVEWALLLKQEFRRTFLRTFCPWEIKSNAWTNAWTKCPCSKN